MDHQRQEVQKSMEREKTVEQYIQMTLHTLQHQEDHVLDLWRKNSVGKDQIINAIQRGHEEVVLYEAFPGDKNDLDEYPVRIGTLKTRLRAIDALPGSVNISSNALTQEAAQRNCRAVVKEFKNLSAQKGWKLPMINRCHYSIPSASVIV